MKICPKCRKTYSDDDLNFCLDDGSVLTTAKAIDDSIPATVMFNQPPATDPNQSFGSQPGAPSGWNAANNPNRFPAPTAPKKSKAWLWVAGILGSSILLCGGGFTAFVFWAASLENANRNANANYASNGSQKSPVPNDKTTTQIVDLSRWVKGDTDLGWTEFKNGEFLMNSKQPGYYYVLSAPAIYKTENAVTKLTVRNVSEEATSLGFGLVIHSNPVPLTQDYAFLIDSENRKYRVVRHVPGDEIVVVGWTRSSAIKDGTEANVLEIRDQDKKMNFYINGEFIKAVDNEDGFRGGVTGIYAGDGVQVAFSNLEIKK